MNDDQQLLVELVKSAAPTVQSVVTQLLKHAWSSGAEDTSTAVRRTAEDSWREAVRVLTATIGDQDKALQRFAQLAKDQDETLQKARDGMREAVAVADTATRAHADIQKAALSVFDALALDNGKMKDATRTALATLSRVARGTDHP